MKPCTPLETLPRLGPKIRDQPCELRTHMVGGTKTPRWSETPVPLNVELQHVKANIDQVAADLFALTKLNYNSCRLGDSEPVTVGFSNAVSYYALRSRQ
jgi:hypothetical protein